MNKKLRRKKLHAKNQNKNFWNKIKRNKLGKGWKQNPGRKNELKFCLTFFTELQKQKFMYKIYRIKNVCIKYLAKILEHNFFDENETKKCSKHKLNAKKKVQRKS